MKTNPQIVIKTYFRGQIRCVLNEGTDLEVDTGWFDNLITDIGLDRLATGNPIVTWASIGTGTTAPADGNTTLQAYVASTNAINIDSQNNGGASAYTAQFQIHHVYAQGAVVGNMAEIGLGWASGGGSLFSRALILDGGGSPTTLTVTSIDQLTVYYKLTATPQITDLVSSFSLSGVTYNYTGRLANAATWITILFGLLNSTSSGRFGELQGSTYSVYSYSTQTLGAITSTPAGAATAGTTSTVSLGSYTAGQKYLDSTLSIPPSDCNSSGGIGSMQLLFGGGTMSYQYAFANASDGAPIPKDNTKTMTMVVRFAWDRV